MKSQTIRPPSSATFASHPFRWEGKRARARIIVVDEPEAEDDIVGLPDAWKNFEDGTPQPNWVALLHEARRGRR